MTTPPPPRDPDHPESPSSDDMPHIVPPTPEPPRDSPAPEPPPSPFEPQGTPEPPPLPQPPPLPETPPASSFPPPPPGSAPYPPPGSESYPPPGAIPSSPPGGPYGEMPPGGPYGAMPPGVPPYEGVSPEGSDKGNIFGLLALIFGISSLVLVACCGLGTVSGAAAVVLGLLGMRKVQEGQANNKTMTLVGLILGGIGLVASTVICAFWGLAVDWNTFRDFN